MAIQSIPCPRCQEAVLYDEEQDLPRFFPFCSERCRLVDLGKWFDEEYKSSRSIQEADLDQID